MDGKQARRTGNSSPLGLLFDHGCDAFTMGMQTMIIAKCIQAGDNYLSIVGVLLPCASFHFSTLEEYYTGGLFLGPFNGVTDGSALFYISFLLMSVVGNEFWKIPILYAGVEGQEIRLHDFMMYFNILTQTTIVSLCLKNIFDHHYG